MKISNIVVGLTIPKRQLNLASIAEKFPDTCKYNPGRFPGASIKFTSPKTTILAFKSGKVVCNGVTNIEAAKTTLEKFLTVCDLQPSLSKNATVYNYVASGSMPHSINFTKIYDKHRRESFYESELFPGLYYKMQKYHLTVIIFSTGRYYMTGSNNILNVNLADIIIRSILADCKIISEIILNKMTRNLTTSLELTSYYIDHEIKIRILDRFLFVEAETKSGLKGVNYSTHKFKSCRKIRQNIDIDKLKAFYRENTIRFAMLDNMSDDEIELVIDKRRAWKPKPAPVPKFDPKKQQNYERFMAALKEIGMIN